MAYDDDKRRGRGKEIDDEQTNDPAVPGVEDEDEDEEPELATEEESEERDWS